jgi:MFS family permease
VQYGVPDELRGRVMSLYVLVFAGTAPIGGLFAGGVAQLWGAPAGFLLGASFSIVFLAITGWQLAHVQMPTLREPARLEPKPDATHATRLTDGAPAADRAPATDGWRESDAAPGRSAVVAAGRDTSGD